MEDDSTPNTGDYSETAFFVTRRERFLWSWVAVIVLGIFTSLFVAGPIADFLHTTDSFAAAIFLLCMFLIAVTIFVEGIDVRPSGWELGIILGIIAVYTMVIFRVAAMSERSHLIEFGVLGAVSYAAFRERYSEEHTILLPALLAIILTSLIGVVDEELQRYLPGRVFDPNDILFNTLAALMSVGSCSVLTLVRRIVRKRRDAGSESS